MLKRLGDAEAAGDRIWAVVRGAAVNQNGAAQELVIEEAESTLGAEDAGCDPALSDMARVAGVGQSDVNRRAGVAFGGSESLPTV